MVTLSQNIEQFLLQQSTPLAVSALTASSGVKGGSTPGADDEAERIQRAREEVWT